MDPAFTFTVDDQDDAISAFYVEWYKLFYLPREKLQRLAVLYSGKQSLYDDDDFS